MSWLDRQSGVCYSAFVTNPKASAMSNETCEDIIMPFDTSTLDVGDDHVMYYEQLGNPEGVPVVDLHGGPGSSMSESRRKLYDLDKFRLVQYDQRGCGKSMPFAQTESNTTAHLVSDIEKLRKHLKIDTWHVSGGSWGSTLALAYALEYGKVVRSLVLDGIFLSREKELRNTYYPGGLASIVFPDVFEPFMALIPHEKINNPLMAYREMFLSQDKALRNNALETWTRLEATMSMLEMPPEIIEEYLADPEFTLTHSLFENHYMLHNCFIDGDDLLKKIGGATDGTPVHIVQGRYDMVCPFETAWELHKAIPHSTLHVIGNAGHSAKESGKAAKLIEIFSTL